MKAVDYVRVGFGCMSLGIAFLGLIGAAFGGANVTSMGALFIGGWVGLAVVLRR